MAKKQKHRPLKVRTLLYGTGSDNKKSISSMSIVNRFNNAISGLFDGSLVSKPTKPPESDNWILNDGIWNDGGVWVDDAVWYDS